VVEREIYYLFVCRGLSVYGADAPNASCLSGQRSRGVSPANRVQLLQPENDRTLAKGLAANNMITIRLANDCWIVVKSLAWPVTVIVTIECLTAVNTGRWCEINKDTEHLL